VHSGRDLVKRFREGKSTHMKTRKDQRNRTGKRKASARRRQANAPRQGKISGKKKKAAGRRINIGSLFWDRKGRQTTLVEKVERLTKVRKPGKGRIISETEGNRQIEGGVYEGKSDNNSRIPGNMKR